jgi:hypothetical protein
MWSRIGVTIDIDIDMELLAAKYDLERIWDRVLPLRKEFYDQPYAIDDQTISTLLSEVKDKKESESLRARYNPFYLSLEQHESFVCALSMMIQIVDDMMDGFKDTKPSYRPKEWKPLQFRDKVCYLRINLVAYQGSKEHIKYIDIPIHVENHAIIVDNKTTIFPGKPRAQSILNRLVKPFIESYKNLAEKSPACMQKFCDKLAPSSLWASCIDARTREAFDYGLSSDLLTKTFTELLQDAVGACPAGKEENYFYLLAALMKQHWGTKYKADNGLNGICKQPGILNLESYPHILNGFNQVAQGCERNNDFLNIHIYEELSLSLQQEYLKLVFKETEFFKSFKINNPLEGLHFNKFLLKKYLGRSVLSFITIDCQAPEIAKQFIMHTDWEILKKIPDIWLEPVFSSNVLTDSIPEIIKQAKLQSLPLSALEVICHIHTNNSNIKVILSMLKNVNPFNHIDARLNFEKMMDVLLKKFTKEEVTTIILSSHLFKNINSKTIGDIFIILKKHLSSFQLYKIAIMNSDILRKMMEKDNDEKEINRSQRIHQIIPVILQHFEEWSLGWRIFKNSKIYFCNMADVILGNKIGALNALSYFIFNGPIEDEDVYISLIEKSTPALLPIFLEDLRAVKFNISIYLLEKIITRMDPEDISKVMKYDFMVSGRTPNEKFGYSLFRLFNILPLSEIELLLARLPSSKLKEFLEDDNVYKSCISVVQDKMKCAEILIRIYIWSGQGLLVPQVFQTISHQKRQEQKVNISLTKDFRLFEQEKKINLKEIEDSINEIKLRFSNCLLKLWDEKQVVIQSNHLIIKFKSSVPHTWVNEIQSLIKELQRDNLISADFEAKLVEKPATPQTGWRRVGVIAIPLHYILKVKVDDGISYSSKTIGQK